MKVVLRSDVPNLGGKGDLVEVAPGYARNYLVPKGLAIVASKGSIAQAEAMKRSREVKARKERELAHEIAAKVGGKTFEVAAKAGSAGRLFGSVTSADVAAAVQAAAGVELDRRHVDLGEQVKTLGEHDVVVRLHPEVEASFRINVVAK